MIFNVKTFPEQMLRDKIGKSCAWTVVKSKLDRPNKRFLFDVAINADSTCEKTVTFDEACKMMGWKSFKFSKDLQSVIPVINFDA